MHTLQFLIKIPVLTKKTLSSCLIRTFLQAGKHVCVEYPMSMNYKAAVDLWNFAEEKGDLIYINVQVLACMFHVQVRRDSSEKCFQMDHPLVGFGAKIQRQYISLAVEVNEFVSDTASSSENV